MKQPEDIGSMNDLACYRLEQSAINMVDAELLMNNHSYLSANNRLYYALFDGVTAVLLLNGLSFRKHKDALGQFNKNFIYPEIFNRKYGPMLQQAEYIRNCSDYGGRNIVKPEKTLEIYEFAKVFLADIYDYCEKNFGISLN